MKEPAHTGQRLAACVRPLVGLLVGPLVDRSSRVAARWDCSSIDSGQQAVDTDWIRPVREAPGYQWTDGGGWAMVDFPQSVA